MPRKRKTTQKFVEESKRIHGDVYDYSQTEYRRNDQKVRIICPKHGEFVVTPNNHTTRRSGCPTCSINRTRTKIQEKKQKEFFERCNEIHNYRYDYRKSEYINAHEYVIIQCPDHGAFNMKAYSHKQGQGCPKCAIDSRRRKLTYTTGHFIKLAKKVHEGLYDYSKVQYTRSNEKVEIICHHHGSFMQRPEQHLRGEGCPSCGKISWWSEMGGYSLAAFNRHPKLRDVEGTLYLVKLSNDSESFYKIGITRQTIDQRFRYGYDDYRIEIIDTFVMSLFNAFEKEQEILSACETYTPIKRFGGWTECLQLHEYDKIQQMLV